MIKLISMQDKTKAIYNAGFAAGVSVIKRKISEITAETLQNIEPGKMPSEGKYPHPRLIYVAQKLADGYSRPTIAQELSISPRTLEDYITKMKEDFEANDITHLIAILLRTGEIN